MSSLMYLLLSVMLIHSTLSAVIQPHVGDADGFRPHVHRYLVILYQTWYDDRNTLHMGACSGSIIDKKWIISAAHCFTHYIVEIKIAKKIGKKNRVLGYGSAYFNHPDFIHGRYFDYYNYQNDLALVKTTEPIKFNVFTQPICLARFSAFRQKGIIAGYGGYGGRSQRPLEGTVMVNRCTDAPTGIRMLCSTGIAYSESGDSGGALTTGDGLIGIIVAGSHPAGRESYYVDISLHFRFIKQITGKDLHKNCSK